MTDDMKLARQRARGLKAQRLWDDPLLQEIFAEIEREVLDGWKTSRSEERDRREEIYYLQRAVEHLKQKIRTHVGTGKRADKELEEIEKERKR